MTFLKDSGWYLKSIQHFIRRASGNRLSIYREHPHGSDDMFDLLGTSLPVKTILDVGANTGQSAIRFRVAFPSARLICFEPCLLSFNILKERTKGLGVECHRLALGPSNGHGILHTAGTSTTNSLVESSDDQLDGTEEVAIETLDSFVSRLGIGSIDLLKIDAEGFDLEVLRGAASSLESGRVNAVLVEVGFHPGDSRHPLFDDVRAMLMCYGFRLFGIYDQHLEWSGEANLRFANAMFCLQHLRQCNSLRPLPKQRSPVLS